MADEKDFTPSFGIMDTMDLGVGNTQLLSDLYSPESTTADPDKLEDATPEPPKKEIKKEAPKKEAPKKEEEEPKGEEEDTLGKFLLDNEEEEEEEEAPAPDKPKVEEEEEEEEINPIVSLSKDLYKLGVFTKDEDEDEAPITNEQEFLERFNTEKKKGAIEVIDRFIGQFGDDYKNAFEAIFVKGVNPKEYFSVYNQIQNFAELDMSKEENQAGVVRQALRDQGFEDEDVESELERLKNYGDLENVAQKHHRVLVKKEASKLAQMEQENEMKLQQKSAEKQQFIQNVRTVIQDKLKSKEFDGIPVNPALANELQDFLLVDKYKTQSGETLTDFDRAILELKKPENHAMKVKVALLLKTLEKDPTLSTIQRAAITKKTDSLFSEVARHKTKSTAKPASKPTSWWQQ
jgi:hypothetical protein